MNTYLGDLVAGASADGGETAATWAAAFAGASALATITTAAVAVWSLLAAKEDSAERARPVVVVELVPNPMIEGRMIFAVVNYGSGLARNVRVAFEPDPLIIENDRRESKASKVLVERWAEPLEMLPPGGQRRNVYYVMDPKTGENMEPLPDSFTVKVSYEAQRGRKSDHRYCDTFHIAMGDWQGETRSVNTTPNAEPKRVAEALEAIARGLGRYS